MGKSSRQLLGEDKGLFIAKQLELKGGGAPGRTAVFEAIRKCKQKGMMMRGVGGGIIKCLKIISL